MKAITISLKFLILVILFVKFWQPAQAVEPEIRRIPASEEDYSIKQELDLAKNGEGYLLLNPRSLTLSLKARGLSLKDIQIAAMDEKKESGVLGAGHRMIRRDPAFPTRFKAVPPVAAPGTPLSSAQRVEDSFVSLKDMPRRYRFYFEDGLILSVQSLSDCDCSGLRYRLHLLKTAAIGFWWETLGLVWDRRPPGLRLTLSEEDTQALYWSTTEGTWLLIKADG